MCTVLLPPAANPIAFSKIYHIKNLYLADGTVRFIISNLIWDGKEFKRVCTAAWGGGGRTFRVGYSELACSAFVSVKINGFGNFLEQLELYTLTAFERLKS